MEIHPAQRSVFDRLGRSTQPYSKNKNRVCSFWLQGKCNRDPCRFIHSNFLQSKNEEQQHNNNKFKFTWRNPNQSASKNVADSLSISKNATVSSSSGCMSSEAANNSHVKRKKVLTAERTSSEVNNGHVKEKKVLDPESLGSEANNGHVKSKVVLNPESPSNVVGSCKNPQQKLCQYWVTGNCVHGDKCKELHSWFSGSGFSLLGKLERHNKAITGIALPSGADKLFSGSKDGSVCVWDCNTGQCVSGVKLDGEIGCLVSEGSWVFAGLQNAIKAWNTQTNTEVGLSGPNGLVNAIVEGDGILFAGVEDGSILAWKSNSESVCPMATLNGHTLAVLSLVVGAHRLYSGSKDNTIRVWDIKTLQCIETLKEHTNFVTSLICWDSFLISGSLDATLKVWRATDSGLLEVIHEVKEESGIVALSGVHDAEAKPVLLCSCKDKAVRLYDLPFFGARGRIFSEREVQSVQTVEMSGGGLFFTGDGTGELSVWRLLGEPKEEDVLS